MTGIRAAAKLRQVYASAITRISIDAMTRLIFTCSAIVCAVVLLLVLNEWWRSYWYIDTVGITVPRYGISIHSMRGDVNIIYHTFPIEVNMSAHFRRTSHYIRGETSPSLRQWSPGAYHRGFGYHRISFPVAYRGKTTFVIERRLSLPHWFLLFCTAILPTIWLLQKRRRRQNPAVCAKCGYDLRASTDQCPECGEPIPQKQHAPTPDEEAIPLCIGCLRPVSALQHYCDHCGTCVGQLTPCLPYEHIPYYAGFFGRLWDRLWYERRRTPFERAFYSVLILLLQPVLAIGLISIARSWRTTFRKRYGLCLKCGYDLRASTDRCPECGEPIPTKPDAPEVTAST